MNDDQTRHVGPSRGIDRLGAVTGIYERAALEYGPVLTAAAEAEAAHKTARAQAILRIKASSDARISHAEAETRAEADPAIAALFLTRLTTRALADSHIERLRQLRTQVEAIRTYVASERDADRFHVNGYTGAA